MFGVKLIVRANESLVSRAVDLLSERKGAPLVVVGGARYEVIPRDVAAPVYTAGPDDRSGQAETLKVDAETLRPVLTDICTISLQIASVNEVVRWLSCSHSRVPIESEVKRKIAQKCVGVITPNTSLACGPSTTIAYCVNQLGEGVRYHVMVTNNVGVIDQVGTRQLSNFACVGGRYNAQVHASVGNEAAAGFARTPCHGALVGASGINSAGELFVRHSEEMPVLNKIVPSATDAVYIVADARKLAQIDVWCYVTIRELLQEESCLREEQPSIGTADEFGELAASTPHNRRGLSYNGSESPRGEHNFLKAWLGPLARTRGTLAKGGEVDVHCKTLDINSSGTGDVQSFIYN